MPATTPFRSSARSVRLAVSLAVSLLVGLTIAALTPLAAASEPERIRTLVRESCAACHGEAGNGQSAQFPQLSAQNPQYLRKQLADFRDDRRVSEVMSPIAKTLSDAQIDQLSAYFRQQKAAPHAGGDDMLAAVGRYVYERGNIYSQVPACASCHSLNGQGSARLPRLAGQSPLYIESQLRKFRDQQRRNDSGVMRFVSEGLTELELRAVAAYVGGMSVAGGSRK